MNELWLDFVTLAAIDPETHAIAWSEVIYLPCARARLALQRPPAADTSAVVAWGNLSLAEGLSVLEESYGTSVGEDQVLRQELSSRRDEMVAAFAEHVAIWTLFYEGG